jgi:hypothetical protein
MRDRRADIYDGEGDPLIALRRKRLGALAPPTEQYVRGPMPLWCATAP